MCWFFRDAQVARISDCRDCGAAQTEAIGATLERISCGLPIDNGIAGKRANS